MLIALGTQTSALIGLITTSADFYFHLSGVWNYQARSVADYDCSSCVLKLGRWQIFAPRRSCEASSLLYASCKFDRLPSNKSGRLLCCCISVNISSCYLHKIQYNPDFLRLYFCGICMPCVTGSMGAWSRLSMMSGSRTIDANQT